MYYFINLFFIFSILGFFMEQGLMLLLNQKYNSSLLKGPWTIVYGIASLIIICIGKRVDKLNYNKVIKYIVFFISSFILLTLLEGLTGVLIEKVLGIVYWDYSNMPLHIGKYMCLIVSLVWSVYASILYYLIYPRVKIFAKKIPKLITVIVIFLFFFDIGYTIAEYLKYV